MKLSGNDIVLFLLGISVILFFARTSGEILKKFKQPIVIGEILAGIILGPTMLGSVFPGIFNSLYISSENIQIAHEGITTLAVVMLMLVSGLEIDLGMLVKQGRTAIYTSSMGVIFPFVIGFGAAYLFPEILGAGELDQHLIFALFIGTALSITALPVVAKTLMDLNILKSEIGFLIIASAMLNDLVGWIIFSLILSNINASGHGLPFYQVVLLTFLFITFFLLVGRKIFNRLIRGINRNMTFPGGVINFVLITGFLGAAFTEYIGIHAIFGAFIIGIAIGNTTELKENTREIIHQFVTNIFAPIFFVSIGLRINFIDNFDPVIVFVFIILAFAGKVIGCSLGAKWGGLSKVDSLAVGFGMNSRGAMEIVLGILGLQFGLIQESVFVALVIMALVTSISSAPFMNIFIRKSPRFISLKNIINPKLVFITEENSKSGLIKYLVGQVAETHGFDRKSLLKLIMSRENEISTNIGNLVAIPHTKYDVKYPVLAVALNKFELVNETEPTSKCRLVFLLISPIKENELQLKLLAEIASKVKEIESIDKILAVNDDSSLVKALTAD